jgi:hypothetical protein
LLTWVPELESQGLKERLILVLVNVGAPHIGQLKESVEQLLLVDEVIGLRDRHRRGVALGDGLGFTIGCFFLLVFGNE